MQRILVLGAGFSGLWSAVGAARRLDQLKDQDTEIVVVNKDQWHNIRVRNYEADLSAVRVNLHDVLDPIGVKLIEAEVLGFNFEQQSVQLRTANGTEDINYDRLVMALGSHVVKPDIPGIELSFDVDTYAGGARLNQQITNIPQQAASTGQFTVVVVGSGLTGCEAATEAVSKLHHNLSNAGIDSSKARVIITDHNNEIGSNMGASAVPVIKQALADLGIQTRTGIKVTAIDKGGIYLDNGEYIAANTVIWCGGMRANQLTANFGLELDHFGRLPVDKFLRVQGLKNVFATGDCAHFEISPGHQNVMSCQHGRPMGRHTGYNVVSDLSGQEMLALTIDWYVTVLDLGAWGAVYTEGWQRQVVATKGVAKNTKMTINRERIYPPLNHNRTDILAAAAPVVQTPPEHN